MKRIQAELREAKKRPINLEDAPELSPEALKEFAHLAAERDRKKKRQVVTLRLAPGDVAKYKSLGKGYTGIMADVLRYAVDNPEILSQVRQ
ncbi:BrnA antitoxin family protein [Treponema primitia]|uniref:BrnA antitoxin family protein n=1 Tax=Treponema primitia TaxID=88058 RepID=UPI00397FB93E